MKKMILCLLIVVMASGCSNPFASAANKEGEEARLQMQAELVTAKTEINAEMQRQLDAVYKSIAEQLVNVYNQLQGGVVIR